MHSALEVAQFIIAYSQEKGHGVSNLRLQKLLYLVQVYFLLAKSAPCFPEKIEAWGFGPVVPAVYREFSRYGACDIWLPGDNGYALAAADEKLICPVVDYFKDYSTTGLVELTTHQTPWETAYYSDGDKTITTESIRKYFS